MNLFAGFLKFVTMQYDLYVKLQNKYSHRLEFCFQKLYFHLKSSEVVVQRGSEKNGPKHFAELTGKRLCWNLFC